MYGDKFLEFAVAGRDAPATVTKPLPMGQGDLFSQTGDTAGMGPYPATLHFLVTAGEDIPAGFTVTLQHSDTADGTFDNVAAYPATVGVRLPGQVIVKAPVPMNIRNWARVSFSESLSVNAVMTIDADKWINGLVAE